VIGSTLAQATVAMAADGTVTVVSPDGTDTLVSIEHIQFTDGAITTADIATIEGLYAQWGGRDATAAELAYWSGRMDAGTSAAQIRAAILADPLGQGHVTAEVTELYQDYGGRAPTAAELAVWQGLIARGADFDTVRQAILADPLGATAKAVSGLYADYMGRAPTDSELGVWQGLIKGGATLATVRSAILDDSAGHAHTDATITHLYQDYGGRAPTAQELTTWEGLVRSGYSFDQVRTTILDDPLGQGHTNATITSLYQAEFGRTPSAGELSVWQGLVHAGTNFDTVLDTLLADNGSSATGAQHVTATAGSDAITDSAVHDMAISGFDAQHDKLGLPWTSVASGNVLDASHAKQVFALDGTPDVLLTLDNGHHVLLEHVQLHDLTAANFQLA
jgi:hypothetical protein